MAVERGPDREEGASGPPRSFRARALSAPVRALLILLPALAAANIVYLAAHILRDALEGTRSAPPVAVALGITVISGVPWLAARIGRRALEATVAIEPLEIVVTLARAQAQYKIPLASVAEVRALRFPLPGAGVALILKSGRRFRYRLEPADPGALLEALAGALPSAQGALSAPSTAFGRERDLQARRGPVFYLLKYGVFPLIFAVIVFRLNQYIVFGGPFGQYRMFGLAAYLKSFAAMWVGVAGQLFVYACVVRLAAEALVFALTWALPYHARPLRRATEVFCHYVAYFILVPVVFAVLLLR